MLAYTRPLAISGLGTPSQLCQALERVTFGASARESGYDEAWLQALIQDHPALLPVAEIEPALASLVPICRELPVSSGYIDNLLMTPDGGIVLVETKLWRNAEARREVVAQVLDYAKDLSGLTYEALEAKVRQARKDPALSLYKLVSPEGSPEEEALFSDAVSRNLRLGRALLMIVGDGIRESVEELASFLQRHVGLQFSLSLVQMALWKDVTDGRIFVQPQVLVRTVQIERAVVRIEQGVTMTPIQIEATKPAQSRPTTISSETFNEQLNAASPGLPAEIAAFLDEVAPLGVIGDQKTSLSLKWLHPDRGEFHLGSILPSGLLDTRYANWSGDAIGRLDLTGTYLEALAALVPGGQVKQTEKRVGWYVVGPDGKYPPVKTLLARKEGWMAAIEAYARSLTEALTDPGDPASTGAARP